MSHRYTAAAGTLAALLLSSQASSRCVTTDPRWYLHTNDKVTIKASMDSQGCGHSYGVAGTWLMEKLIVMKQPSHGRLRQIGEVTFYYIPKADFRGQDNYVIYICGKDTWGKGCARLNYEATVE